MTTLDPSHIQNPFSNRHRSTWGQATHSPDLPDDPFPSRPGRALHVPQIPELRFEQSYLMSIKQFINQAPRERQPGETQTEYKGAVADLAKEGVLDDSVYGVPLRIDWQGVAWVTLRDQASTRTFVKVTCVLSCMSLADILSDSPGGSLGNCGRHFHPRFRTILDETQRRAWCSYTCRGPGESGRARTFTEMVAGFLRHPSDECHPHRLGVAQWVCRQLYIKYNPVISWWRALG